MEIYATSVLPERFIKAVKVNKCVDVDTEIYNKPIKNNVLNWTVVMVVILFSNEVKGNIYVDVSRS